MRDAVAGVVTWADRFRNGRATAAAALCAQSRFHTMDISALDAGASTGPKREDSMDDLLNDLGLDEAPAGD